MHLHFEARAVYACRCTSWPQRPLQALEYAWSIMTIIGDDVQERRCAAGRSVQYVGGCCSRGTPCPCRARAFACMCIFAEGAALQPPGRGLCSPLPLILIVFLPQWPLMVLVLCTSCGDQTLWQVHVRGMYACAVPAGQPGGRITIGLWVGCAAWAGCTRPAEAHLIGISHFDGRPHFHP